MKIKATIAVLLILGCTWATPRIQARIEQTVFGGVANECASHGLKVMQAMETGEEIPAGGPDGRECAEQLPGVYREAALRNHDLYDELAELGH